MYLFFEQYWYRVSEIFLKSIKEIGNEFMRYDFIFLKEIPQVLKDVSGIPWGIYAGSPADPKPSVQLVQPLQSHVGSMMTFSLNEIAIISPFTVVYTVRAKKGILFYFAQT